MEPRPDHRSANRGSAKVGFPDAIGQREEDHRLGLDDPFELRQDGLGGLDRRSRDFAQLETLDLRSSGDTAGGKREVVGYGTFAVV